MTPINICLSLVLSTLIVIFIHRITSTSKHFISLRNLLILLISFSLVLLFLKDNRSAISQANGIPLHKSRSFRFMVTPQVFNQMLKFDANYISGIFYERRFKMLYIEDSYNHQNDEYRFTLLTDPSEDNQFLSNLKDWQNMEERNMIREYAYMRTKTPNTVFYILKNSQDYTDFQNYLAELPKGKISPDILKLLSVLDNSSACLYEDCVFKFAGFQIEDNGYRIETYNMQRLLKSYDVH